MSSFILERNITTCLYNNISIKSNNILAKKHFDEPNNCADLIIRQINDEQLYKKYLNGDNLTIFDIGGNIGLFSLHCVDCAKTIYSFEPTPKHYDLLTEFTKDYKNIIPINVAICDKDCDIDFYMSDNNTTMNSIANIYGNKIVVKGRSIISFIQEHNIQKVDFIKCDIEGSEMIALKEECIKPLFEIVDKWFIEVHATSEGSIESNRNILVNNFQNVGYKCELFNIDGIYVYKNYNKHSSIVFTTFHNPIYNGLAEITLTNNKDIYCKKHNYPLVVKTDNWHNFPIGYEKVYLIKEAFDLYPNCEWVFFSECDTLITNMNIKLEDIIKDEDKHFVITTDINGINAGNFFIKNSKEGHEFLEAMKNSIDYYANEQQFIIDSYFGIANFKDIISLYPQKKFNSYDYYLYDNNYPTGLDYIGNNGRWEYGDFIIHFPGKSLDERINLSNQYLSQVINS